MVTTRQEVAVGVNAMLHAGTRADNPKIALELAVHNLRRLHKYAMGIAEEAKKKNVEAVSAEDLRLLDGLQFALDKLRTQDHTRALGR